MKREDFLRNELAKQFYKMDIEDLFVAYKVMNGLLDLGMDEYPEKDSKNFKKWLNEKIEYEPVQYEAYEGVLEKFISEHKCSPTELEKILSLGLQKNVPRLSSAKVGKAICESLSEEEFIMLEDYLDNNNHSMLYEFTEKRAKELFPEITKSMISRVVFKIAISIKSDRK